MLFKFCKKINDLQTIIVIMFYNKIFIYEAIQYFSFKILTGIRLMIYIIFQFLFGHRILNLNFFKKTAVIK